MSNKAKQKSDEIYSLFKQNCTHKQAIDYGVFCVDEILNELQSYSDIRSDIFIDGKYISVVERLIFWNEVKQEIEKHD